MMTAEQIIDALGGRKALAEVVGVSRHAPYNWLTDGIPSRHWPDLVERAAKLGVQGVTFNALRATKAKRQDVRDCGITSESTPVRKSSASGASRALRKIETVA
jgi:hypothetical protein